MRASLAQKRRYWDAAPEHLAWCRDHDVTVLEGAWSLEDPITGLLLAAVLAPSSATTLLNILCRRSWGQLQVTAAWWPRAVVDLIVNFVADGSRYTLILENKHLNTPSNQPGYKSLEIKNREDEICWQTETMLRTIDRVRAQDGEKLLLGGPFDPEATVLPVFLDATGRSMDEAFPVYDWMVPRHRHGQWSEVSYAELARGLRESFEAHPDDLLKPLLGQLFAASQE